ncbi:hypothetical protein J6590_020531 [Homalodisca vitripennis]|nr:hypothetical protein J6590_020531 [Homalodisca vitripennis]
MLNDLRIDKQAQVPTGNKQTANSSENQMTHRLPARRLLVSTPTDPLSRERGNLPFPSTHLPTSLLALAPRFPLKILPSKNQYEELIKFYSLRYFRKVSRSEEFM